MSPVRKEIIEFLGISLSIKLPPGKRINFGGEDSRGDSLVVDPDGDGITVYCAGYCGSPSETLHLRRGDINLYPGIRAKGIFFLENSKII